MPLYERAVTYEGEEFNCRCACGCCRCGGCLVCVTCVRGARTTAVRGTRLPSEAQALSEAIVAHVAEVCMCVYVCAHVRVCVQLWFYPRAEPACC